MNDCSQLPAHLRLLNLLVAVRDLSPFAVMTAEEDQLLRSLLIRWNEARNIPVSEIMNSMTGASAATAYRRLISLRDKGMVQLRVDKADRRVKFVDPTELAQDYADRLNLGLKQLAADGCFD